MHPYAEEAISQFGSYNVHLCLEVKILDVQSGAVHCDHICETATLQKLR